jgi:hypothetical protein
LRPRNIKLDKGKETEKRRAKYKSIGKLLDSPETSQFVGRAFGLATNQNHILPLILDRNPFFVRQVFIKFLASYDSDG